MDYQFSDFLRHLKVWSAEFRKLTIVPTRPSDPASKTVHVGESINEQSTILRIDYMLARDGCPPAEQRYRCRRFFFMMRFIALHELEFAKAGFFLSDDGTNQSVSYSVLRAVHETFSGEPLRHSDTEPVEPVVTLALSYPPKWHSL